MGRATKIEWCDHTFNPWRGCQRVSEGCRFCYAELLSKRNPAVLGDWAGGKRVIASDQYWRMPIRWDKLAEKKKTNARVFSLSMGDVWENRPELIGPRSRLFKIIWHTKWLDWLLLTKRPFEAWNALMVPERFHLFFEPHVISRDKVLRLMENRVWHGVSVENQATAEERIPMLLSIPALLRFVSAEPLLGPIGLHHLLAKHGQVMFDGFHLNCLTTNENFTTRNSIGRKIDWVIVGGESGHHARPMHPHWVDQLHRQCDRYGAPFFFKQWGEWATLEGCPGEWMSNPERFRQHQFDDRTTMLRVGKKRAGRYLDGREYNEFPGASENSAPALAGVVDASRR